MNKRTLQAFALGILFAAIFLWTGNLATADKEKEKDLNLKDARSLLEEKGYKVLTKKEFATLSEPKKAEETTPSEEKNEETKQTEEKKEEPKQEQSFTLVIASGMTPGDIALMLKSQGIIEDEGTFEQFLIDKGYHTKIQIGQYEIKPSMDFDQIAKIITKNR